VRRVLVPRTLGPLKGSNVLVEGRSGGLDRGHRPPARVKDKCADGRAPAPLAVLQRRGRTVIVEPCVYRQEASSRAGAERSEGCEGRDQRAAVPMNVSPRARAQVVDHNTAKGDGALGRHQHAGRAWLQSGEQPHGQSEGGAEQKPTPATPRPGAGPKRGSRRVAILRREEKAGTSGPLGQGRTPRQAQGTKLRPPAWSVARSWSPTKKTPLGRPPS
jgi:hypothetical protein